MWFIDFPKEINTDALEVVGYLQGERLNKRAPVTIELFETVTFLHSSENDLNKREFIHAIAFSEVTKRKSILILKV